METKDNALSEGWSVDGIEGDGIAVTNGRVTIAVNDKGLWVERASHPIPSGVALFLLDAWESRDDGAA